MIIGLRMIIDGNGSLCYWLFCCCFRCYTCSKSITRMISQIKPYSRGIYCYCLVIYRIPCEILQMATSLLFTWVGGWVGFDGGGCSAKAWITKLAEIIKMRDIDANTNYTNNIWYCRTCSHTIITKCSMYLTWCSIITQTTFIINDAGTVIFSLISTMTMR